MNLKAEIGAETETETDTETSIFRSLHRLETTSLTLVIVSSDVWVCLY